MAATNYSCLISSKLALSEIYFALTKLLWNSDLELEADSVAWDDDMKIFHLWVVRLLVVRLKPAERSERSAINQSQ